MNNIKLKKYIKNRSELFWWIKEQQRENISLPCLIETILNFGNEKDIKNLFNLINIKQVAEIFYKQIKQKRNNYHQRTINFFKLYFDRHAH